MERELSAVFLLVSEKCILTQNEKFLEVSFHKNFLNFVFVFVSLFHIVLLIFFGVFLRIKKFPLKKRKIFGNRDTFCVK